MKSAFAFAVVFLASVVTGPFASAQSQGKAHKGTGVVKSVDAQKGTVTLAHGPIKSLDWPSMTMRFSAKDKKMLEAIKPGDKVEFEFVQEGSKNAITSIK